jgi:hypothetical protein
MKFNLWTQYGALNSKPVFEAFRQGCRTLGFDVSDNSNDSDVDVIWSVLFNGRMAPNKAIWERNIQASKPTIVLEVGGIKRGITWKVGLNGINRDAYFGDDMGHDNSRAIALGLKLKPWNTKGKHILICGQHEKSLQWQDMPSMSNWVIQTVDEIQKYTNRTIIIRPHPRCPLPHIEHEFKNVSRQEPRHVNGTYDDFDMGFDNIYCTVNYSSNPGIHSVMAGVPSFVSTHSLAYPVANDIDFLHDIESPLMPDRQQWLNNYAHTEYTIEEIAQGIPLKRLTNKLN